MRRLFAIIFAAVLANAWLPGVIAFVAGLDKAGFTFGAVFGFGVVALFGFLFLYKLAWNARGDYDEHQAIEGIKKKNQSARM